jgi:hypothetical protein
MTDNDLSKLDLLINKMDNVAARLDTIENKLILLGFESNKIDNNVVHVGDRANLLEKRTKDIESILENETRKDIELIAQGHLNLTEIRLIKLENDVKRIKEVIGL